MSQRTRVNESISLGVVLVTTFVSLFYLGLSALLIGFKPEQLVLVFIFNGMYYSSAFTRKFITGFSIFIIYWIIFDYMKAFPNYKYHEVHIESLYNAEKSVFGIQSGTTVLTPNEWWTAHRMVLLDLLSGIFYLCWIPVPLAFAAYLFFRNRKLFLEFSITFFLVNIIGFIVYYMYPAAPPWYVQYNGFDFNAATPGNTAGLSRFDELIGAPVFHSLYAKGSNVFAAMPSLHSSYPLIVLFYGIKGRLGVMNVLFFLIMCGIWFSAVYSCHHYVLDVIAGIFCAITGIFLFQKWLSTHSSEGGIFYRMLRQIG
ncbi:MAG: phosphatase PAP2 family protein [Flavitalea sp.]